MSRIRHVLLDGDGVLQRPTAAFEPAYRTHLGESFEPWLREVFASDGPVLRGRADLTPLLAAELAARGNRTPVEEVYAAVWFAVEVDPEAAALVRDLRARGLGVHLASNQDAARARHMRTELGYDTLMDRCFFSCELGAAKPTTEFFAAVLSELADPDPPAAEEVVFVDDHEPNVAGAREAGLVAFQFDLSEGVDRLRALLEECLAAEGTSPGDGPD